MDHNLEDPMAMESIENMDFDHSGVVVNQEDITLEGSSQASDIHMDLGTIEEQPVLLDGGSEEVIVSDFIGDQYGFQEYSVQGENSSGANITIEANQMSELVTQNEPMMDFQYADCASKPTSSQSGIITIKAVPQQRASKKVSAPAPYPRQVAIAPKPMKGAPNVQYAIAPKPVAIVVNKNAANASKSVPMKTVMPVLKGNTVLAQIGKQFVMMPASATGQKIKLSSILSGSSTDSNVHLVRCSPDSAQLVANKKSKPWRTPKQAFYVQGQPNADPSNQPAVITKLVPVSSSTGARARYVMQQKTVPISIGGNKVVLTTPPKQGSKIAPKKQIISFKSSQSPKMVTSQANMQTKKVVISANPSQPQIAGVKMSTQAVPNSTTAQGQRTQLQSINVPGKGIQIIKLVTNQPPTAQKPTSKPQPVAMSGKNFVLTDAKGNIIQMTAEKVGSGHPASLLMATTTTSGTKVPGKGKKFVRIAPVSHKSDAPSAAPKTARAPQSLLMPRDSTTVLSGTTVSLEEFNEMVEQNNMNNFGTLSGEEIIEEPVEDESIVEEDRSEMMETQTEPVDVKPTLASLVSDAVAEESEGGMLNVQEVELDYDSTPRKQERFTEDENTNSVDHEITDENHKENLIVIPPNMTNDSRDDDQDMYRDDTNTSMDDSHKMQTVLNVEADVMSYLTPQMEQPYSDSAFLENTETPGMRPRKACNCTKSRCLKLYCDCFANGEFCNNCNCNNCHNNLENEELRQVATRACLDRNPNAFRPKIGKAKSGGPEIIRRHTKGCNCKRSGCLKNYCECYEAKIACTMMCKCVGCRNIEETIERRRDAVRLREKIADTSYRPPPTLGQMKQPCSFMTPEVIEAVAQCMLATVAERGAAGDPSDPVEEILLEFSRCMADIISASHQAL